MRLANLPHVGPWFDPPATQTAHQVAERQTHDVRVGASNLADWMKSGVLDRVGASLVKRVTRGNVGRNLFLTV